MYNFLTLAQAQAEAYREPLAGTIIMTLAMWFFIGCGIIRFFTYVDYPGMGWVFFALWTGFMLVFSLPLFSGDNSLKAMENSSDWAWLIFAAPLIGGIVIWFLCSLPD